MYGGFNNFEKLFLEQNRDFSDIFVIKWLMGILLLTFSKVIHVEHICKPSNHEFGSTDCVSKNNTSTVVAHRKISKEQEWLHFHS